MNIIEEFLVDASEECLISIKNQTWKNFQHALKKKHRIIIYGVGAYTYLSVSKVDWSLVDNYYFTDNNPKLWGHSLSKRILAYEGEKNIRATIVPPETITDSLGESVILISSMRYYAEIKNDLINKGFINECDVYCLLYLEANEILNGNKELSLTESYCEYPIQMNKVLFSGFGTYSCHGKYILEALLNQTDKLDLVCLVKDLDESVPQGIRRVLITNKRAVLYEFETARVWLINTLIPDEVKKRENQYYIHTKHWSSITLKKFYLGSSTLYRNDKAVLRCRRNGSLMDYIFTGSDFDKNSCRGGFDFRGEFISVGSPRSDVLFSSKKMKSTICKEIGISDKDYVVIYAPTYRYQKDIIEYVPESRDINLQYDMVYEALQKRFGKEWKILLRLHPSVAKYSKSMFLSEHVVDVSDYPDSQELVAISDVMITDYSSIMFEPAFVYKPVFLFATDKDDYINKEYDLLIDYDTLPFPIAESNEELVRNILQFNKDEYDENLRTFFEKYGVHEDGHASERAADFIIKLLEEQQH